MDAKDFYGIYRDLAEQLGVEATIRIYEHLHGLQYISSKTIQQLSYGTLGSGERGTVSSGNEKYSHIAAVGN